MGKLRFMDAFDKSCLIINFIFCKYNSYHLKNTEILQFMLLEPPDKIKKVVNKLS